MIDSITSIGTDPPCVYSKHEQEILIHDGQIFIVARSSTVEIPDDGGRCPYDAPQDGYTCVGMGVHLLR